MIYIICDGRGYNNLFIFSVIIILYLKNMLAKEGFSKHQEPLSNKTNQHIKHKNMIYSQFSEKYKSQISQCLLDQAEVRRKLEEFHIKYRPNEYLHFQYEIKQAMLSYHILKINVRVFHFQLDLYILNEAINNPFDENSIEENGKFGEVYFIKYLEEKIAIKSIKISQVYTFAEGFEQTLKQVSIMKICSILGCSLNYQRYFGFDLIVYNDCMQFAMKRGEYKNIKQDIPLLQNLKHQLALMHRLNIVHCDIKPENIIFCPSQNTFVFIDFGFADVIEDDCGYKSKTRYKGSPQYSSPEMASIFVSEGQQLIDLYYNDLYGLKKSILVKIKEIENEDSEQEQFQCQVEKTITAFLLSHIFVNNFKYYYTLRNIGKLRDILNYKKQFLFKQPNSQLLTFIKDIYHQIFIPEIYYSYFNCYEAESQYTYIQKMIKEQNQTIFFRYIASIKATNIEYSSFFQRYLQADIKKTHINNKSVSYGHIFEYFMKMVNKQNHKLFFHSEDVMFGLMLQCLRFDKKNLKFAHKLQLSVRFRLLIGYPAKQFHKQSIEDIKIVLLAMVDYLLKPQLTKWKYQKGFQVFYQLIIIGVNINQALSKYIASINAQNTKMEHKFILVMDIKKLHDLLSLKRITLANLSISILYKFFDQLINQLLQQIVEKVAQSQLQNLLHILCKIIRKDIILSKQDRLYIQTVTVKIQNPRLIKLVRQVLSSYKIFMYIKDPFGNNVFKEIKDIIQKQYQNNNLLRSFSFTYQFLSHVCFTEQMMNLDKAIKLMFDCQQIYKTFHFQYYCFLANKQDTSQSSLCKYMKQILQNQIDMRQINTISTKTFYQIYQLILKIKFNTKFIQENQKVIIEVYLKYIKFNCFWSSTIYGLHLMNSFLEITLVSFTPALSVHFCQRLSFLEQKYLIAEKALFDNDTFQNKIFYSQIQFQLMIYKSYQAFQTNSSQYIRILGFLQNMCRQYFGQMFAIQIYGLDLILQLLRIQQFELVNQHLERIDRVLQKSDKISYYLNARYRNLLELIIFIHFTRKQFAKIYKLLQELVEWISKNPFEAYLIVFITNVQIIFQYDRSIFLYSNLQNNITKLKQKIIKNPYYALYLINSVQHEKEQLTRIKILKFVCLKICHLSTYSRKHLQIYLYLIAIDLLEIPTKKKMHIMKFTRNIDKNQVKKVISYELSYFTKQVKRNKVNNNFKNKYWAKLIENIKHILQ